MSQAATPSRSREAGLSLMEILVAVSILAIMAFAVTLSMQPASDPVVAAGDRLAARLHQASQEAIAGGQPVGLAIGDAGARYEFYRYVDGRWWPLSDHPTLTPRVLEDGLVLRAEAAILPEAEEADGLPVIWFDPAGLTDPFVLRLQSPRGWRELSWAADGSLSVTGGA